MDDPSGRDLLKMALVLDRPTIPIPLFGVPRYLDPLIEPYVKKLGLRDLPQPQNELDQLLMELQLLKLMVKVIFRIS